MASDINVLKASSSAVLLSSGTVQQEIETFSTSILKMTFEGNKTVAAANFLTTSSQRHNRKSELVSLMRGSLSKSHLSLFVKEKQTAQQARSRQESEVS